MYQQLQSFSSAFPANNPIEEMQTVPRVDVLDSPGEIIYIFEVPGMEINTVNVEIENGNLMISGQVETGLPDGELNYLYQERPMLKKYGRLLSIPPEVEQEKAMANIRNGLLLVHFPKKNAGKKLPVSLQEKALRPDAKKKTKKTVNQPEH